MQDICDHLTTGKSLIDVASLKGYPSSDSMYRQMARDPDFAARIAQAREAGQDHEADAIVRMADAATNDDWQVVKLRIWARQWRAAKLAPKRYGDRIQHTGADGGAIQLEERQPLDLRTLSPEQRELFRTLVLQATAKPVQQIEGEFREAEDGDE